MHINIHFIKQQLSQRKLIPTLEGDIGSVIKYHRIKQDMTLEESSDGICSVSYLSKVENNLIAPSEKYVEQLKERLSIVEEDNYDYKQSLMQMIQCHFYQHKDIKLTATKQKDARSILLRLSYYVLKKTYDKAYEEYIESLHFIKNYNHTEIILYLYCISHLFVHQGLLEDGLMILMEIDEGEIVNPQLKTLIQYQKLMIALELNHYPYLMIHYVKLKEKMLEQGAYHLTYELKKKYYSYLALAQEVSEDTIKYENDLLTEADYMSYIKALNSYRKGDYQNAYDVIAPFIEGDETYIMLAVKALSRLENHDLLIKILNMTHSMTAKDHLQLFGYVRIKMNGIDSAIQYLKDEVIKNKIFYDRYDTLIFYYEEISSLFRKKSFYKEMAQFNQKMIKKVLLRHEYLK